MDRCGEPWVPRKVKHSLKTFKLIWAFNWIKSYKEAQYANQRKWALPQLKLGKGGRVGTPSPRQPLWKLSEALECQSCLKTTATPSDCYWLSIEARHALLIFVSSGKKLYCCSVTGLQLNKNIKLSFKGEQWSSCNAENPNFPNELYF